MSAMDELVELLRARLPAPGQAASALPGVWLFRADQPTAPGPARTSTMTVAFAVQGKKWVRVDGVDLGYDPRSYLVVRGDTSFESSIVEASPRRPYLAVGIQIPPDVVVHTLLALAEHRAAPPPVERPAAAFSAPLDDRMVGVLARLMGCLDDPAERHVLAPLVMREMVFHLMRSGAADVLRPPASGCADCVRVRQAMTYIEQRAADRLSVDGIARHVAMSPSHFAHRFREVAQLSPMQYLKHVRLERARVLLLGNGLAASEIARAVGYASAAHFTRDFKRQFGLAPTGYARAFADAGAVATGEAEQAVA
jgi:AraC-like DNA-binding protein